MGDLETPGGDETIDPAEQIQKMTFSIVKDGEQSPDIQLTPEQEKRIKEVVQEEVIDAGFDLPPESTEITIMVPEHHAETNEVMIGVDAEMFDEPQGVAIDFTLT